MLRNHSHYSLLSSTSRCEQIVKACKNAGYSHAGITDIATISGCVNFIQACKKSDIKPIIGCEIILDNESRITLICKNNKAWTQLLKVISIANSPENFKDTPRISFHVLLENIECENFICIDGYVGSAMFSKVINNNQCVFDCLDDESIVDCLVPNYMEIANNHFQEMQNYFSSYFIEINKIDHDSYPITKVMCQILEKIDPSMECIIPDTNSYYPERKDAIDHRVLLCTKLKTTMKKLDHAISEQKDLDALRFIRSSNYYIKHSDFLFEQYNGTICANLNKITNLVQDINILSNPKLPAFKTEDSSSEDEYLKQLCRNGWKKLISNKIDKEQIETYRDRVVKELEVIKTANLAGYFLIVQDYVNHFRNIGCLIGPARGSGGGSLVCYLTGITLIDPIKYGLLFERFFNAGRYSTDNITFEEFSYKDFMSSGV